MEDKKNIIVTIALVIVLILVVIVVTILNNKREFEKPDNYTIIYSYGGGFGTMAGTATREITIQSNGSVTIDLKNHEFKVEPLNYIVQKEKADGVMYYLIDNGFEKMKEDLSDNSVLDGGSYYIEIKSKELNKKVGGYAPYNNKKFSNMEKEVLKLVDEKKLEEFDNRVNEAAEKQE